MSDIDLVKKVRGYAEEAEKNGFEVLTVPLRDLFPLLGSMEAAERERDELRAEQAEHDEQIARMESKFSLAKRALDSKTARCDKAEAELRRRDAAAGEPVAFTHESEISNMHATGLYLRGFPADRRLNSEEGYTVPLYTAAPPAASAPDGLAAAVNRLLDSDGSRGTFSAIRRSDALAEVERLLAAAPAPGGDGG